MSLKIFIIAILLVSCAKNNDRDIRAPFSPTGLWKGSLYSGGEMYLLNRADGTSRIYFLLNGTDTADATRVQDGRYTVSGNTFVGSYISTDPSNSDLLEVHSSRATAELLNGACFRDNEFAFTFELVKQP